MANDEKSPRDAFILAEVERALALYRGLVPPALLETMRETLEDALRSHPVAVGLIDQLSERAAPQRSDDLPREGVAQLDQGPAVRKVKRAKEGS
jgi:hypothetical protein